MSLVTRSTKRNRIYYRAFDHEEAQRLHQQGWTVSALARHFGVTYQAVKRVVDERTRQRMNETGKEWFRRQRRPCLGGCGALVWHQTGRSGLCNRCVKREQLSVDVRDGELRCATCREWKPDEHFPTYRPVKARRGRNSQCRACSSAVRREYRTKHPDKERESNARLVRRRREKRVATTYVVLRPSGNGFVEHSRVLAASPAHAIEQAADEAGDYIAVIEGKFKVMTVAPVQAFRVVSNGAAAE